MQESEKILEVLQKEFLTDPENFIEKFHENILNLKEDPRQAFRNFWSIIHTMKGNAQAIGFPHYAHFLTEIESGIKEAEQHIKTDLDTQSLYRLQNILSKILGEIQAYLDDLRSTGKDSENLMKDHASKISELKEWKPGVIMDWDMDENMEQKVHQEKKDEFIPEKTKVNNEIKIQHHNTTTIKVNQLNQEIKKENQDLKNKNITTHKYLVFKNTQLSFAIPLQHIIAILEQREWFPLPYPRFGITGVIHRFGEVLPIIDWSICLSKKSNLKSHSDTKIPTIIIAHYNEERFCIPAEEIQQIVEISSEFLQKEQTVTKSNTASFIEYFAIINNQTIYIADIPKIVEAIKANA